MRLHRPPLRVASLSAAAGLTFVLAGCSSHDGATLNAVNEAAAPSATGGSEIAVAATDTTCAIDQSSIPAGPVTLKIHNGGTQVTEVYVLNNGGTGIVTERENIQPNSDTDLTAELPQGAFLVSCRPASGERVNTDLTVTSGSSTALSAADKAAVAAYRRYVQEQVADTVRQTRVFVAALQAGDLEKAKGLFATSRFGWEVMEPVAEAFGDIDPKVDMREADLEDGQAWTGWHAIEKKLWVEKTTGGTGALGDDLLKDLAVLTDRVPDAVITPTSMANGAKELLDEVAAKKITGEEDTFSHTDLSDFRGNVEGAQKVFELLKPIAAKNDPDLVQTLATEFADVQTLLKTYENGSGYVSYDTVTEAQRKELSDAVNALGEPLSRLAGAVV